MSGDAGGGDAGSGSGAGTAGGGAGSGGAGGAGAGQAGAAAPWHQGVAGLDADIIGHAQNKGWLPADVKDLPGAFAKAVKSHSEAEKLRGVPIDQLIRIPTAASSKEDWDTAFQRLGVPREAKDYDFAGIKYKNGADPEAGFVDKLRGAFAAARVTKEGAAAITKAVISHFDEAESTKSALLAGQIAEQKAWLDQNWPAATRDANLFIANQALAKIGAAAGLTAEQTKTAWDALSKLGGVGAGHAMEMLRTIGMRMGEGKLISLGAAGDGGPMTLEAAKDEIAMLKNDKAFRDKLLAGGKEETLRWRALHKIVAGNMAA